MFLRSNIRPPESALLATVLLISFSVGYLVVGGVSPVQVVVAADSGDEVETYPASTALLLGPLPVPPPEAENGPMHSEISAVPEVDPRQPFPSVGQKVSLVPGDVVSWQDVEFSEPGSVRIPGGGVYWIATRMSLARWAEITVSFDIQGEATLFVNGEERSSRRADDPSEPMAVDLALARGTHTVLVRVAHPPGVKALFHGQLTAEADPRVAFAWSVGPRTPPAAFDRTRELMSMSNLAVAPGGRYVARRIIVRNPTGEGQTTSADILDAEGVLVASGVGGESARPVDISPDGKQLLLIRAGADGTDVLLWTLPAGPVRTVLKDEPGLGLMQFSPDGRLLLFASSQGVEPVQADSDAAYRQTQLQERIVDFLPRPHLNIVDLTSGVRQRLTAPGDHVLDDAVWLPDGQTVVYGITLPRSERPWFHTEIHRVELRSSRDEILTTFVAGWEVRPQRFACDPAGKRLLFVGPPEELGPGHEEHNVYNKQLWILNLDTDEFERITRNLSYSFEGGGGLPVFDESGHSILTRIEQGSTPGLGRLVQGKDRWDIETYSRVAGAMGAAAISPDGEYVAFVSSTTTSPPELSLLETSRGMVAPLEQPNDRVTRTWQLSSPEDASFRGPGGEEVEAWWYPPTLKVDEGKTPLVLYYYAGSVPVTRNFNPTHQYFAANGYAVLVINPRGAHGYGDEFADHHAGDWGPAASADILAGLDAFLSAHPEIDGSHVGIYGGSYGGFMTEYLVTETDRFAAAVSLYGIADLATYWGQGTWGLTYGDMALAGATPWGDTQEFVAKSPLYRADRVRTPLLLLHGESDTNVTPGESLEFFTALAMQDKMVELVLFPGEDHGISGTFANRVSHRTMILEWFDKFLRDQPGAWAARWQ